MKKLEIKLYKYENCLFGKVKHIDESLRGELEEEINYKKDFYTISSNVHPQLDGTQLWVCGSSRKDDDLAFCYQYSNNKEAEKAGEAFKLLVDKINEEDSCELPIEEIM